MGFAIGAAIAPVLGGKLTDLYGFREASDIIAMFTLVCGLVNFFVVFVPNIFCKTDVIPEVVKKSLIDTLNS